MARSEWGYRTCRHCGVRYNRTPNQQECPYAEASPAHGWTPKKWYDDGAQER